MTPPPLDGVVVLDFSELLPGPFFTQNLVELGATVIRIERPPHGDKLGRLAPAIFTAVNRGKQRFMLDLREASGRAAVRQWLGRADVLVESYRPGVLAKYGLDYASLQADHPGLIYVSLSGYGQDGPDAPLPGHDANYLAAAGVLSLAGDPDGAPHTGLGVPVADLCGASYALSALLAALFQRERTGQGQHLDVALAEGPLHWMNPRLAAIREGGHTSLAAQRAALARAAYGVFACRDHAYISIAALEDHFWANLCATLDMGRYAGAEFTASPARRVAAKAINHHLASQVLDWDSQPLMARLAAADVPAMLVREPGALSQTRHFVERQLFVDTDAGPLCRFPVPLAGMIAPPPAAAELQVSGAPVFPGVVATWR